MSLATPTSYASGGFAQTIVSGLDSIAGLTDSVRALGIERAMVICGPGTLNGSDVVHRVESALGPALVGRFGDVGPLSSVTSLHAARDQAMSLRPDTLVSVGGGSATVIAKGVALLMATDREITDFEARFEPPYRVIVPSIPLPPITTRVIAVPTTIGCAEIGPSGGGFSTGGGGRKISIHGNGSVSPSIVVIDGRALATTPERIQRSTAMGQLRVAVESFNSVEHNPVSDSLALHAIRLLSAQFSAGWQRSPDYLLDIKLAAAIGQLSKVAGGSLGVNSAIAHQVGGLYNTLHGEVNGVLLPHSLEFNSRAIHPDRMAALEGALGASPARSSRRPADRLPAVLRLRQLQELLGVPRRLRDLGVPESGLNAVAAATVGDMSLRGNPRAINDEADVLSILEAAW